MRKNLNSEKTTENAKGQLKIVEQELKVIKTTENNKKQQKIIKTTENNKKQQKIIKNNRK